jgi:hypothetical protein
MNISTLMQDRAAIDAQIEARPSDLSHEQEFKGAFDRKWQIEETILSCRAVTIADRAMQIKILAGRARDGVDVADDLERLLGALSTQCIPRRRVALLGVPLVGSRAA